MSKKTEWYPGIIKPVRSGKYECQCGNGPVVIDYWDNLSETWGWKYEEDFYPYKNSEQDKCKWRGLTEEAK